MLARLLDTLWEVLVGWAVGLTVAGVAYGPVIALSQGAGLRGMLKGLMLTPTHLLLSFSIGALISLPLIVLAMLAAWALGNRPARSPRLMALGIAAAGMVFYGLGDMASRGDLLDWRGTGVVRPLDPVMLADMTIVFLAIFGGCWTYCLRLRRILASREALAAAGESVDWR